MGTHIANTIAKSWHIDVKVINLTLTYYVKYDTILNCRIALARGSLKPYQNDFDKLPGTGSIEAFLSARSEGIGIICSAHLCYLVAFPRWCNFGPRVSCATEVRSKKRHLIPQLGVEPWCQNYRIGAARPARVATATNAYIESRVWQAKMTSAIAANTASARGLST